MKNCRHFARWTFTLILVVFCAQPATAQIPATNNPAATPVKLQFFIKLTPPRATFPADITPAEQQLMDQHAAYWAELFKAGKVLILGPVFDPKGAFGMGVIEAATEAEAHAMANNDPTVKAGLNTIEILPMHVFVHK